MFLMIHKFSNFTHNAEWKKEQREVKVTYFDSSSFKVLSSSSDGNSSHSKICVNNSVITIEKKKKLTKSFFFFFFFLSARRTVTHFPQCTTTPSSCQCPVIKRKWDCQWRSSSPGHVLHVSGVAVILFQFIKTDPVLFFIFQICDASLVPLSSQPLGLNQKRSEENKYRKNRFVKTTNRPLLPSLLHQIIHQNPALVYIQAFFITIAIVCGKYAQNVVTQAQWHCVLTGTEKPGVGRKRHLQGKVVVASEQRQSATF